MHIARRYLLPRQLAEHGLARCAGWSCRTQALRRVITRVHARGGRAHARAARSAPSHERSPRASRAARLAAGATTIVDAESIPEYLGPPRFRQEVAFRTSRPGVATGVAWTETGGDVLFIEASLLPGGHGQMCSPASSATSCRSRRAPPSATSAHTPRALGISADFLEQARPPRARPGRRHSEGRPVGGRDDGHGDPVGAATASRCGRTWR